MAPIGQALLAPSPAEGKVYDFMYYIKGAAAGGICCSVTHGALTPVDVVKTRVQLDPIKVRLYTVAEDKLDMAKVSTANIFSYHQELEPASFSTTEV